MTKKQLRELIDEQADTIAELMDRAISKDKKIAYLEGMVNGLGIRKKEKSKPPAIIKQNKEFAVDCEDEEFLDGLAIEHNQKECDCAICIKERNLEESSEQIQEWSEQNGIDVEKGSPDDN